MRIRTALVLSVLASGITLASANAAIHARFDIGNVSAGYRDGYYDNDHHWHHWRNQRDMARYREAHGDMYHAWRHDDRRHRDDDQH